MLNAWYLSIQPGDPPPPPGDNDPPNARDDSAETDEETPVVITVLANDTDPDNDPLTVTQVNNVQNGSANINADNTVTFTPNPEFFGTGSFNYTISDGRGGTDTALVTIDVSPINDPPIAVDDFAETDQDEFLTFDGFMAPRLESNDLDPDGDLLTVIEVGDAVNGSVILSSGVATFFPNPGFVGIASFTYVVSDPLGMTDGALVTIDVLPGNRAPIAVDDFAVGVLNRFITFDGIMAPQLESNDIDADADTLAVIAVGGATNGSVLLNNGIATFFPNPGFVGTASFTYVVSDGELTDEGLVTIRFTGEYQFSATTGGSVIGTDGVAVTFADADILQLAVTATGHEYSLFFDGSNFGLTTDSEDIDAFTFLADGTLVVSMVGAFSVPGPAGTLTGGGEDLLRFSPNVPGNFSAGAWSFYFDGSDVGLFGSSENIDAVGVLFDGRLLISTSGVVSAPGVSAQDEDLLAFYGQLGPNTLGSWSFYFDGSDVGLTTEGEDIDGLFVGTSVPPAGHPRLFFSTMGDFSVPGVSGANEDVFAFAPTSLGGNTTGSYGPGMGLNGSDFGLGNFNLDGFSMRPPQPGGAGGLSGTVGPAASGSRSRAADHFTGLRLEDVVALFSEDSDLTGFRSRRGFWRSA
jgi:hypothetical protein